MAEKILHICTQSEWQNAQIAKEYQAASLESEGFIHCSQPDQILKVANQYYPEAVDLTLLWIDVDKLKAELRWESSDGDVFPHLYGPLNLNAVLAAFPFQPDETGVFRTYPKFE